MPGGLFCVHKRLTTGCPECKPSALPKEEHVGEARFVTEEEREKRERRREALFHGRALDPGAADEETSKPRRPPAATPAAAAALARRQKAARKISPQEADSAKPWWIKK